VPSRATAVLRPLIRLQESPVRWPVALQAGLSMGLPVALLTLLGRPDLGLLTSSGAFASLYLAYRSRRTRAVWLPVISAGLFLSATLGVLTAHHPALALVTMAALTAVSSLVMFGLHVGPPGAVFFVLSAGVSGHLTSPATAGGAGLSPRVVLGMLLVGLAVAYAVTMAPMLLPGVRARDRALHEAREPAAFSFDRASRIIVTRVVAASAVAALVCIPLGVHRAYWVMLTVVAILQAAPHVRLTISRGVQRVVGTFLGMGVFALVWQLHSTGLWLALVLGALQFLTEIVVTRNYGLALLTITPLAMTMVAQGHHGAVSELLETRLLDTVLGAAVAMVVLLGSKVLQDRLWRREPHWVNV